MKQPAQPSENDVLRQMLNTPPQPHVAKSKPKAKKKTAKKRASK